MESYFIRQQVAVGSLHIIQGNIGISPSYNARKPKALQSSSNTINKENLVIY